MQNYFGFISIVILGLGIISCSTLNTPPANSQVQSNGYTTAFPSRDISPQLQEAKQSVVRILSTSYYTTYSFSNPNVTLADIRGGSPKTMASQEYTDEESTAGTAIILDFNRRGEALLITCAHAVSSPDTLLTYYTGKAVAPKTFIQSISIKKRQSNLLMTEGLLNSVEILTENRLSDLALLAAELTPEDGGQESLQALAYPMGHAGDIQLGSFLYILGFPKGFPMITRGIASTKAMYPHRFFVTDALFNPGISGGLIISSKDHFESFEWIGMARSATASRETVLVPHPDKDQYKQGIIQPYDDIVFVEPKERISYGITQAIPIDEIRSFIENHRDIIEKNGFRY